MRDDRLHRGKGKKRSAQEEEEAEIFLPKKFKAEETMVIPPLARLPVELLYNIHLYAKNPSFTMVNHYLHTVFSGCPVSIKAKYLIARWHEAYCYGFYSSSKIKQEKAKMTMAAGTSQQENKSDLPPSTLSRDLLQGGLMVELSWSSRFLPVLPTAQWPHPLSLSSQRSVDHFILDACLRYPVCNHEVLRAVEDIVLSSPEFGNVILATGLWRREVDSELCTYDVYRSKELAEECCYVKPSHLMVNELPKRLFRNFDMDTLEELAGHFKDGENHSSKISLQLIQLLKVFGAGPLPSSSSLLLLLEIISLHFAYSLDSYKTASNPINSYEGLPLAKSTFQKSQFMVQLLLYLGADPSQMEGMSLLLAIRSGWLEGLQMMVERDYVKLEACKRAIVGIRAWYQRNADTKQRGRYHNEDDREESQDESLEQPFTEVISKKRRRLADRVHLDTKMLKEAVKYNQWTVANWIHQEKKVAPDLRTLQLIEIRHKGTR